MAVGQNSGVMRKMVAALGAVAAMAFGNVNRVLKRSSTAPARKASRPFRWWKTRKYRQFGARGGIKTLDMEQYRKRYSHCMSGARP